MNRAERRHLDRRTKARAAALVKRWGPRYTSRLDENGIRRTYFYPDDENRRVGRLAAVHGVPCSCPCCGNHRKHLGPTIQEQRTTKVLYEKDEA